MSVPAMSRMRAFLGFSRIVQATLSVAQPFLVAVVALHGFPSPDRLILGLSAAWAGFLAVFSLNDLLDVELDRARFNHLRNLGAFDIDSAMVRHPLAQGLLTRPLALAWIASLAAFALLGAYLLNPPAAALFLTAALLEVVYCKLARVTAMKFVVSGAMVGVGALAGWVAMTAEIRPLEMAVLFIWMAAWEIGGRNIVNDFADVEEDTRLGIKTIPLVYGPKAAARLTLWFVLATAIVALLLPLISRLSLLCLPLMVAADIYLLLWPAFRLLRLPAPASAMALFNRASFYPPVALAILVVSL